LRKARTLPVVEEGLLEARLETTTLGSMLPMLLL
jgi:hypothetical protein